MTNECFWTTRFVITTFISEHKNDSNTQRFEMNTPKYYYSNYKMCMTFHIYMGYNHHNSLCSTTTATTATTILLYSFLYISQNFIMACFAAFEKNKLRQILHGSHRKLKPFFKDFSRTKFIFQGPFVKCHITCLTKWIILYKPN